jgi:hypothetical protein
MAAENDPSKGLHYLEDDLAEGWLEDWAGAGVKEVEIHLGKRAAFYAFLDEEGITTPDQHHEDPLEDPVYEYPLAA